MRRRSGILALVLVSLAWVIAIVAAPAAASQSNLVGASSSAMVYAAGSLVCHQRPDRSFHLGGAQLPVCARCAGLYAGGVIGAIAWALVAGTGRRMAARARRFTASPAPRNILALAGLPTAISVATAWVGWWDGGNALRALLALPLGAAIGACLCAVAGGDLE